jgi:hypothetical protein
MGGRGDVGTAVANTYCLIVPNPPIVLWEVRGKSGKPITCSLERLASIGCRVTVVVGDEQIFAEDFKRDDDAIAHAGFLRRDFVGGGWIETFRNDE